MSVRVIVAKINPDSSTIDIMKDAMLSATKVYNGLLWHLREEFQATGKSKVSRRNLNRTLKLLPKAKEYYSLAVQSTRDEVIGAYKSFFALRKNGHTRHNSPKFRRKNVLSPLKYLQSGFKLQDNTLTLSLGNSRQDGVKALSFAIAHRNDVDLSQVKLKGVTITYDKRIGLKAHLVVESPEARPVEYGLTAAVDLGETNLISAVFSDGTKVIYSGRLLKAVRRYWQKVRSKVKPPSKENPHMSKRYWQICRNESNWTANYLHQVSRHFVNLCKAKGVKEIIIGQLTNIREEIDYGKKVNQRLHAWPFARLTDFIRYKAEDAGITVRRESEAYTSQTCHNCGMISKSNRKHRGFYTCKCGYAENADINGAANLFFNTYNVSPLKRSSGDVTSPALVVRFNGHMMCVPA